MWFYLVVSFSFRTGELIFWAGALSAEGNRKWNSGEFMRVF